MSLTNEEVAQWLGNQSVMTILALTKELEEKWGVEAKPQFTQVQPDQPNREQVPTKDEFDVVLASVPTEKKMNVIKAIRECLGLGLKESKELAESAPKTIKEGVSKMEADELVAKLTDAGAVVEAK